jgi:hypothetical protein
MGLRNPERLTTVRAFDTKEQTMNHLQNLACRVSWGDPHAVAEFRRELEGRLPPIVRNTLRTRRDTAPLNRLILKEADRMTPTDGEEAVGPIIRRVCDCVIDNLWSSQRPVRTLQAILCN